MPQSYTLHYGDQSYTLNRGSDTPPMDADIQQILQRLPGQGSAPTPAIQRKSTNDAEASGPYSIRR